MLCRVIVLPKGGTEPIADLGRDGPPETWKWDELRWHLVARHVEGCAPETETFLCLLGDELIVRRDRAELDHLLSSVREHTWGSRLFLVVNEGILPSPDLVRERASIAEWFATALSGRVLDLLQVCYDLWAVDSIQTQRLQDACSRAGLRQRFLSERARERRWRCLVPEEKQGLIFHLLAPFLFDKANSDLDVDLVIVVPYVDPSEQVQWVEEARGRYPAPMCRVVTLTASGPPPKLTSGVSSELTACCERQGLGEPVALTGFLELWYLLLRLNAGHVAMEPGLRGVQLDERPLLAVNHTDRQPHVLMSSSFYLDEEVHLEAAAYDVGALLALAPLELSYHVEPALTREKLIEIASGEPAVAVWIHMGHAGPDGLVEFGDPYSIETKRWLDCWFGRELRLVLFLTCESDVIAERFARAGAGVAIGFTAGVETDKPRQVARAVFKAVMAEGLQRKAILAACKLGAHHFTAVHEDPCEVRAYYPLP